MNGGTTGAPWWRQKPPGPPNAAPPGAPPPPGAPRTGAPPWLSRRMPAPRTPPGRLPPPSTLPVPPTGPPPRTGPPPPGPAPSWWASRTVTTGPATRPSAGPPVAPPIGRTLTIGRDPRSDVVIDDLRVSRRHAELRRRPDGWRLVDLGSPLGTFVNGARIGDAPIGPRDVIGIGRQRLHLVGERLEPFVEGATGVPFSAHDLVVEVKGGKRILDGVEIAMPGKGLLAVIGPSGAGKSTLLGALTGFRPATSGRVLFGGHDLYETYDELRHRIGLVPQDDILHRELTVRRALAYAAALRFPPDVTEQERDRRIDEVIAEMDLTGWANHPINKLSGGQRKRTNVALELLTKPSLLFLDEPTSGLDPHLEKSVMRTLRGLADDGRTVIVVTHNMESLDLCDQLLVLAPGGRLAYFGPPAEALTYFGQPGYPEVFEVLANGGDTDWTARYRASPLWRRHVGPSPVPVAAGAPPPPPAPVRQQSAGRQFAVLTARYLAVIRSDPAYLGFLALLPLVLSFLTRAVPAPGGLSVDAVLGPAPVSGAKPGHPGILLLVLIMCGTLMGTAASLREIVKEQEIYRRERAVGLSLWAYLASKVGVLGAVVTLQAVTLTLLALIARRAPDDAVLLPEARAEVVAAVVAVALGSTAVGLLISAAVNSGDKAMPLMVLTVMVQTILCGGLFPVPDPAVPLAWLTPARWAFGLGAATVDVNRIRERSGEAIEDAWRHDGGAWLLDVLAAGAVTVVLLLACAQVLRRLDARRARRARR